MDNLKALKKSAFFISFPFSFIAFIFPIYAYYLDIPVMKIGYMYSALTLFTIIMRPSVGAFIDKRGRKIGIVLGIAFYCLMNLLLLGGDFKYLMAARIFQGIAASFFWISVNAVISDISHGGNRSETFGMLDESINKGDLTGIVLGFIIVSFLSQGSFKAVFKLYLTTSLISFYYAVTKLEETKYLKQNYIEESVKTSKYFNMFLILMGLLSFIFSLTSHTYLIYITENITDKLHLIGYLFIPGAILSMFLPKRFGKISDRYSREKIFIISILFMGISYLFVPAVKSYIYFLAVNTLIYIFSMLEGPAESALVIDIVGESQRGKSYGKYKFAVGIGGMLGPLVGSYIYENIGSEFAFYTEGTLAIILCIFLAIYFRNMKKINLKGTGETPINIE